MQSKLIIALDYPDESLALQLVDQLDSTLCKLKVGSEMFTALGPQFVRTLVHKGFNVFLDLKFHDIPNTVARACKMGADLGVWMMNVHAAGGRAMLEAASQSLQEYGKERPLLTAVTVLTSLHAKELTEVGIGVSLEQQVFNLAQLAAKAGLDGVVCSALEVPLIKKACGEDFITVTPGIRLPGDEPNDQSRVITPEEALRNGSDFLVMGRSITQAMYPGQTVQEIITFMNSASL